MRYAQRGRWTPGGVLYQDAFPPVDPVLTCMLLSFFLLHSIMAALSLSILEQFLIKSDGKKIPICNLNKITLIRHNIYLPSIICPFQYTSGGFLNE